MRRFLPLLLLPFLLSVPTQQAEAQSTLTCKSRHNDYKYCRADTKNRVELDQRLSRARCVQGRSWGYDRHGIWVDDGCEARFSYGHSSSRRNSSSESRRGRHHDDNDGNAAAAVAIGAGLAVLLGAAAVAASNDSHHKSSHNDTPPSWMVGTYQGYNDKYNANVEMTVHSDGSVDSYADGQRVQGSYRDGQLHFGDYDFDVERAGGGFRTIQRNERDNEVHYRRVR